MPRARETFTLASKGSSVFLVGEGTCDVYDAKENSWKDLNMPQTDGFGGRVAAAVIADHLYVVGGRPTGDEVNAVASYDCTSGNWKWLARPPKRQDCISAFAHNNLLYLIGWQAALGTMVNIYDPLSNAWFLAMSGLKGHFKRGVLIKGTNLSRNLFNGYKELSFNVHNIS